MSDRAYATFDDVDDTLSKAETNERIKLRMHRALVGATERLNDELGFDFFRHPADPADDPEVRLFSTNGRDLIHVHFGLVSVEGIRVRTSRTTDWIDLETTDYDLEAWAAANRNQTVATDEPFDHIRLNGTGTYSAWPRGLLLVEVTGVFGWPRIPRKAIDANVDMARQATAADRTYPGGVISPDEAGMPMLPSRLPDSAYRLLKWALYRYSCDT